METFLLLLGVVLGVLVAWCIVRVTDLSKRLSVVEEALWLYRKEGHSLQGQVNELEVTIGKVVGESEQAKEARSLLAWSELRRMTREQRQELYREKVDG